MRVLVIDEELPWPQNTGKRIRTYQLLERLARSFEVTLTYPRSGEPRSPESVRRAFEEVGISLLPVQATAPRKRGLRFLWDLLRNVFLRVPYMVMAHRSRALRGAVAESVSRGACDLVHVEWTPLVANVPGDIGVPVCISAHNVESQIWRRYRENEANLLKRAYIALQARKVARFEREALAAADAVTAVSEADADTIRAWTGQQRVTVVPNGVDAAHVVPRPDLEVQPDSVLFVGALDWRPNLDGLTFFLDRIWPRILDRRPGATFTVVGRNPPRALEDRLEEDGSVTLAADVPAVEPYVATHAVSVVPLRIGGGSRLKICEALAMERPLVSTSVGAEGLDLGDGILRADEPEAFAEAVLGLFDDPEGAAAMAQRGRARILERYTWDVIAPLQAEMWRRTAAAGEETA